MQIPPAISLVFVTNRPGALEILHDNLRRQTFTNFELVIADDLADTREYPLAPYKVTHFKPRQKQYGDAWNLNKAYNDALGKAQGLLLVFLQDYIWIPANGLERFWEVYQDYPDALVTGVGHKAQLPDTLPVTPCKPTGVSEMDERVYFGSDFQEADYSYWELNWASCPRRIMPKFEEDMDKFYGGDNQVVALKASRSGHKIYVDRTNQCIGYNQALFGRPDDWEERHSNKENRLISKLGYLASLTG